MPTTPSRAKLPPTRGNTCAVVVTYHSDDQLFERLSAVASQVDRVFIVDNASSPDEVQALRQGVSAFSSFQLVENSTNLGVAAALNQGVELARAGEFQWLLTLDQDTWVDDELIATYAEVHAQWEAGRRPLGMLGANYRHDPSGRLAYIPSPSDGAAIATEVVITSGSLLSLHAAVDVGGFADAFFIDCVDNEYCLRLRRRGYEVIMTTRPLLRHALGDQRVHRLLWKRPICTHHSPLRHYYMTRNRLRLVWTYRREERRWARRELKAMAVSILLLVLYERPKIRKLRAVLAGAMDALRGRSGPLLAEGRGGVPGPSPQQSTAAMSESSSRSPGDSRQSVSAR